MGMLLMGGWAQGVFQHAGFQFSDYLIGPAPQDDGKMAFDLNSDEFIFWQKKQPEFQEGQKLLAKIVMAKEFGPMYSQITGSIPVRTDTDLSAEGFSDGQREAAQAMADSVKANRVVLSLAHNMAQPNQITAAMIDVLTEFVHDNRITSGRGPEAPGGGGRQRPLKGLEFGAAQGGNTCSAICQAAVPCWPAPPRRSQRCALRAQAGKPRVTVISQWSSGSSGAAMMALGKEFERQGGVWEHNPVPGFTTEMMNKLRAQIIAGDPPAASQLKGPEIAAWSKIAPVVDLDAMVKEAGYEAVVPAELARLSKPHGHWIALPIQAYRINTLFISKKAADQVGVTKLPATWAEFNAIAEKMKAAGITPIANGGIKWDDGMKWEIALCGISLDAYRKALMELDEKTLKGPEVLAAFRQFRKLADWSDPGIGQPGLHHLRPALHEGRDGHAADGRLGGRHLQARRVPGERLYGRARAGR